VKNSGLTRQVTDSARLQCQIWLRARSWLAQVTDSARLQCQIWLRARSWLAQATDSARLQCQIRLRRRTGLNLIKTEKLRLIILADEQDYVSTRTRSKISLEMNKAIMSKSHEEGGGLMSSERLASAFLLLGIADTSENESEIEPIVESESMSGLDNESEPLTYKAALQSSHAKEWKEVMRQQWQALVENHTVDIVLKGNTVHKPMANVAVEEPIGCNWIYKRKVNRMDLLVTRHD
jgi:UDP-2,3-diacylglucosamine pyrophosphatase LpxH